MAGVSSRDSCVAYQALGLSGILAVIIAGWATSNPTLYRAGLARTRRQARQMVSHGHFTVNGVKVDVPSYRVSQYDIIEEALRWGAVTHLVSGQRGVYPALNPAATWARRDSRFLEASMTVAASENAAKE